MLKGFNKAGLLPKVFMTIAITSGAVCVYRLWLGPYVRRQRYKEAEAWAAVVIEQEKESNRE